MPRMSFSTSKNSQRGVIHHVVPLVAFVVLFAIIGSYYVLRTHAATPAAGSAVTSGYSGMCLDDYHNSPATGARVDINTCNKSVAQDWQVGGKISSDEGTIHNGCMTIAVPGGQR